MSDNRFLNPKSISENTTIFKTNHAYRLRLLSDSELLSKAEGVYGADSLISKEHTLDSSRFGATITSPICQICKQKMSKCVGHYAVIQLPFPIPRAISIKDFKNLIELICPICSHFLISNIKSALEIPSQHRLAWIRKETNRITAGGTAIVLCNTCKNRVPTIKVSQSEPSIRFILDQPLQGKSEQLNPIQIYVILQNFVEVEEAGFSEAYDPKNFMTSFIPIIPNKLRPKTLMSSESNLTGYYKVIIEEICPELYKISKSLSMGNGVIIEKGEIQNSFNKNYDKLMAYYLLITDVGTDKTKELEMALIEKRDKKHTDQYVSLLTRFKGKSHSIMHQGIIATRHNVSARTVLGGATDSNIKNINIPYHIAVKLSMYYPVYVQNLDFMKQLVASMSNQENLKNVKIPRVFGIWSSSKDRFIKTTISNAISLAAILRPGDKISISLMNGDWVMQVRFPSLREESWTSMQVKRDDNSIITIPLPCCEMKSADFDGDEAQTYAMHSHITDTESILLHSVFKQMIGYKDGNFAIWYSADAPDGLNQIARGVMSNIYNYKVANPPIDVLKMAESYLPHDLSYKDSKTEIKNGKFIGDKVSLINHDLHKYITFLYGADITENLMAKNINLAYDINKNNGNTLGFEITIHSKEIKEKIKSIVEENYQKLKEIEQSQSEHKFLLQKRIVENQKAIIEEMLIEDSKNTNLGRLKYTTNRIDEFYQMVVLMDYTSIDGGRIEPILADGTRTSCAFPRHSVDPHARGYNKECYSCDISPVSHFYDCKSSRQMLFVKGSGTAKQGYLSKRLGVAFGGSYLDFSGQMIDNYKIISPQYGNCGLDPRRNVKQPLIDASLNREEFDKKYGMDSKILKLRDKIDEYRERYRGLTMFTKKNIMEDTFIGGFYYNQYIDNII